MRKLATLWKLGVEIFSYSNGWDIIIATTTTKENRHSTNNGRDMIYSKNNNNNIKTTHIVWVMINSDNNDSEHKHDT